MDGRHVDGSGAGYQQRRRRTICADGVDVMRRWLIIAAASGAALFGQTSGGPGRGQKTMSNSSPVVIASDQTPVKVDLSATSSNSTAVKVDGSAVTQPISGTVTANQGGTWTVQPGNTANTTPWLTNDSATSNTGASVPPKASYIGGNASGNLTGLITCDKS